MGGQPIHGFLYTGGKGSGAKLLGLHKSAFIDGVHPGACGYRKAGSELVKKSHTATSKSAAWRRIFLLYACGSSGAAPNGRNPRNSRAERIAAKWGGACEGKSR